MKAGTRHWDNMVDLSTQAKAGTSHSRLWLAGALTVVLFLAIPNLSFPLGRDQATYCLIGEYLLRGRILYRDLWDNKPPGIFYIYALIVKVFGSVIWSVGVVDVLWLLAMSGCIFRFARKYLGVPAASLAVVLNAAFHCTGGYIHAAQPETFLMLFLFLAFFLLDTRNSKFENRNSKSGEFPFSIFDFRCFAAGLVLGAAFWMKYNALVFLPLLMFLPCLDARPLDEGSVRLRLTIPWRRWFTRMAALGAGFSAAVLVVLAHFAGAGAWGALREVQFEVVPRYAAMVFERQPRLWQWVLERSYLFLGPWSEAMWLAALLIAWRRRELAQVAPVLAACVAGYLAAIMQARLPSFYFETCYPFFAMCWGYVCVNAYQGFRSARVAFARRRWRLATALLWVLAANLIYLPLPAEAYELAEKYEPLGLWWRQPRQFYAGYMLEIPLEKLHDQLEVIDYLKEQSRPEDEVYIWGTAPLINFLAKRPFPSRFVSNLALISPWGPPAWRKELVRDLEKRRPRFIVVARHDRIWGVTFTSLDSEQCLSAFPSLAGFLASEYQPVRNLDNFEIYRLK